MLSLGVECTAHTFGIGIMEDKKILADARSVYAPKKGSGIHPLEAAKHHREAGKSVLESALKDAKIELDDVDLMSYSAGPGLPPCLKAAAEFARNLSAETKKPVIPVNHCIAHIEIGRLLTQCSDPVVVYVSGGNTQIIGYASRRYRIFGETQDIAIGNTIDVFIRETTGEFPGGPAFDRLAGKGENYIELPYVVKGMDLSFSGILTAALKKYKEGAALEDLCYSIQETCYAMLAEVAERALAHTGKSEALAVGGVAASKRFQEMLEIMCNEREAECFAVPAEYARDNGIMICWAGMLAYGHGQKPVQKIDFYPRWRTDEVVVS